MSNRVVLRTSYGELGSHVAVFEDGCNAQDVLVEVRPLTWEPAATWTGDNVSGPDAREHPAVWLDANARDRLLLFGGMSFTPRQFTVVSDLWELNLATGSWRALNVSGAPAVAIGRVAAVPDASSIRYHGGIDQEDNVSEAVWRLDYDADAPTWTVEDEGGHGAPPGPVLSSFIYDAPRERYINACG